MRKYGFLALAAALPLTLCGCGNIDGAINPASSGEISAQTTSLVSGLTESSADLSGISSTAPAPSGTEFPSKLKIYEQTSVQFTEEQLFEFFSEHPECGAPRKSEYYRDDLLYWEADGCLGYINGGNGFYFTTDAGSFCDSVRYYLSVLDGDDPDKQYLTDGDLDFAAREQALEDVRKELAERFGIMPDEWFANKLDAVTKEGAEAYRRSVYSSAYPDDPDAEYDYEKEKTRYEKIKDLPADDFYYFDIQYKTDDIPLFMGGILDIGGSLESGRAVRGTMSYVVYGRNGIEFILISPAYEPDTLADSREEVELIPADQARGFIQKKYDEIVSDNVPEVLDMKLFYLPIPQNDLGSYGKSFEMRPYYGFFLNNTDTYEGETFTYDSMAYFDAVTGEELATQTSMDLIDPSDWGFDV